MTQLHGAINVEERPGDRPVRYSVCTLVNDADDYGAMVESFRAKGFREPDCEFLYVDNRTENRFDAFAGYNRFPRGGARHPYHPLPPGRSAA